MTEKAKLDLIDERAIVRTRLILLALCVSSICCATSTAKLSHAYGSVQAPNETPALEVQEAVVSRCEEFLQGVATLSPLPAGTDPDWAQAWPRYPTRRSFDKAANQFRSSPRKTTTKVFGHELSGTVGAGRAWIVELYGGELRFSIDGQSRVVRSFRDSILSTVLFGEPAPLPEQRISNETAISRATDYARLTGVDLNSFILDKVSLENNFNPPSAATVRWNVTWRRAHQGVSFFGQSMVVLLDAHKGRLLNLGVATSMQAPVEMQLKIQVDKAAEIAATFLRAKSKSINGHHTASLRIVLPTDFWSSGKESVSQRDPNSRLAWIVRYPIMEQNQRFGEVWVDAGNGAVIGGDNVGALGPMPPELIRTGVRNYLSIADRLELRPRNPGDGSAVTLSAKSEPLAFYGALAGVSAVLDRKTTPSPTHTLIVRTQGGKTHACAYDAERGIAVDADGALVNVGPALKELLQGKRSSQREKLKPPADQAGNWNH